jgi:hypothetical protein
MILGSSIGNHMPAATLSEKDLSALRRAQEVIWCSEDRIERALASRTIMRILLKRDIEEAERYLRYAELFSENSQKSAIHWQLRLSRARLDAAKGHVHIALDSALKFLEEAQKTGDSFPVALSHATIAEIHLKAGNITESQEHEAVARRMDGEYGWKIFSADAESDIPG